MKFKADPKNERLGGIVGGLAMAMLKVGLSPPCTGAAELVAWRWKYKDRPEMTWQHDTRCPTFVDASKMVLEPLYAAPPVKGDREAITNAIINNMPTLMGLNKAVDAILSLPISPGAGEREPTPDMRIAGGIAWAEASKTAETFVDCADACWKAMWDAR